MPTKTGIHYFIHETENKTRPAVILIHGAGGFHLSWPPQVRRMDGLRVIALDLPGHGKSDGVGRQSIAEYVEDASAFLKALKIQSAVLVGHSMGSAIALSLALKYPGHARGLILIGGGAKLRVAPVLLEGANSPNVFPTTVKMINDFSFGPNASPRLKELAEKRLAETRPAVLHGDLLACNDFDARDQLEKINIPTLAICGTEDKMTPLKYSEFLRDNIRDAKLEIVDGAGHMLMLEQPDLTARLISRFVEELHVS